MGRSRSSSAFMERFVTISIAILLFFHFSLVPSPASASDLDVNFDDDEDLSFLEEPVLDHTSSTIGENVDSFDSDSEEGNFPDFDSEESDDLSDSSLPPIDEKDVVVLTSKNFTDFIAKSKHIMVEFYAPWCGHCQSLAPEYAEAATTLKEQDQGIFLAKVDATEESDLGQKYNVQGFPTIIFFIEGVHKPYNGQRTKEGIVKWINSKLGPSIQNVTTIQEAQKILESANKLVLGFLDSLTGADSQELSSASKLEDDVNFYQTVNSDVAKLFNIDPKSKRPSLVLLKNETEKISHFDGPFTKSGIADFVFANKLPLIVTFTMETASLIFENPVKKQILMFTTLNETDEVIPVFEEVAKSFKGKIIFVFVEIDNEEFGVPVANYFGITGEGPKVLAFSGNEDATKFMFEGNELTVDSIMAFSEDFLHDKLKPSYKSDPIPETNDGDVKVVVGKNFDEIVLDESKDVLLEIYAPWCGHCQALEPIYNKLALHLRSIESLVIAKMDGVTNEHPRAKADGFPTILFYPAGNKSFEPITSETDRTVVALYKFIKKHASIPFKLQKPAVKPETIKASTDNDDLKDEL